MIRNTRLLSGVSVLPRVEISEGVYAAIRLDEAEPAMDINRMHQIYGHANEDALRKTAKKYNWELTGKFHMS